MASRRIARAIWLVVFWFGAVGATVQAQQWVVYNGTMPANAVVGGTENGHPLYVGRMVFQGGLHPGKILPGGICNIGWGGKEYSFDKGFEVLTAAPNTVTWIPYIGSVPANAVPGGYNSPGGTDPLYVVKHAYLGGEHCGKLWAGACNIGYGGAEIVLKEHILLLVSVSPKKEVGAKKLMTSMEISDGIQIAGSFLSKSQQGAYTSWSDQWQLPVAGKAAVLFKASANNDIHVALSDAAKTMDPMYEIVIGGWNNTKSVVRRRSQGPPIRESKLGIPKAGVPVDFWVMVDKDKGMISAGHGTAVGKNVIVEANDVAFLTNVRYVALSSWNTPIQYTEIRAAALAEIEMDHSVRSSVNLALHKPCAQSSRSQWSNNEQGAVDGVKNGSFGFHTGPGPAWWQVDLGSSCSIDHVVVFNRTDCCQERARTIQLLHSVDGANFTTAYSHPGGVFGGARDGNPLDIQLNGAVARYVRLQITSGDMFHLDEVEVYGSAGSEAVTEVRWSSQDETGGTALQGVVFDYAKYKLSLPNEVGILLAVSGVSQEDTDLACSVLGTVAFVIQSAQSHTFTKSQIQDLLLKVQQLKLKKLRKVPFFEALISSGEKDLTKLLGTMR